MGKNLSIKILAILFATLLWIQQMFLKTHSETIDIPIHLNQIPKNLIFIDETSSQLPVIIESRGLDLLVLKMSNIFFETDARNFRYGKNALNLSKQNLVYPRHINIDIKKIGNNKENWIVLDRLVKKKKPIEIEYASAKDEEFFLSNKINNQEQRIELKGPMSIINKIKNVQTQKISKRMIKNGQITVFLIPPDKNVQLLKNQVVLQVTPSRMITKTISLIPVKFPINQKITIIPQKVTVIVRGPIDIVDKLNNRSITASIDVQKIKKNDFVDINFELPPGIKLLDHTPQKIQVIKN